LWIFLQAGQWVVSEKSKVLRMIISVVMPVGTGFPNIGHEIIISAIRRPYPEDSRPYKKQQVIPAENSN
jgi:hypothetical protein